MFQSVKGFLFRLFSVIFSQTELSENGVPQKMGYIIKQGHLLSHNTTFLYFFMLVNLYLTESNSSTEILFFSKNTLQLPEHFDFAQLASS